MSTAEAAVLRGQHQDPGDSIVKLTVLEAKALGDYLEDVHGIKPAAAAVAAPRPRLRPPPSPSPPRPSSTS